ncbi:hypothetical protein [Fibrobacter sp. UBA4297]|uniref:hypothetical protein n=1 Tax=Fibrobacter sp. UBA4297 TaxID=1946536 RepID=UPI0025B9AF48|nr:hypothetical protein [Fibrobacter sp. UBA4297]
MAKINKPRVATDTSLLVVGHNRGAGFSVKDQSEYFPEAVVGSLGLLPYRSLDFGIVLG